MQNSTKTYKILTDTTKLCKKFRKILYKYQGLWYNKTMKPTVDFSGAPQNAAIHLTINGQTTRLQGNAVFTKDCHAVHFGELQGFAETKTAFTVWDDRAEMQKTGEFTARIPFGEGHRERVELRTAMGDIPVTVTTTRFAVKREERSLFLRLSYTLSDGTIDQPFAVTLRVRLLG